MAKDHILTFNESRCTYNTDTVDLLGYDIKAGTLQPHLERLKTLQELSPPKNHKEQPRIIGLFAYYAQWISQYSNKIKPLITNNVFPIKKEILALFLNVRPELVNVFLGVIDENAPFAVETDA